MAPPLSLQQLVDGVRANERSVLARAITLLESRRPDHRELADELVATLLPHSGGAHRIGITGTPGAGKSTFIDQFGLNLIGEGHRVAVLAVDPTSSLTGGSILGDKTRMERLSVRPEAFIRPSPAGETLGGVARATRETILVCEAAGYDVVIVETVGVGQSETTVADMVDIFCVLMIAGGGDDLQGIKKGVLELADLVAVNKADGANVERANRAAADLRAALHLLTPATPVWSPPVLTCSALTDTGLDEVWRQIRHHRDVTTAVGGFDDRRRAQQVRWMWSMVDERLQQRLRTLPGMAGLAAELEGRVRLGELPAPAAADRLWHAFLTAG